MSIDKDTVKHISKLARISLDQKKVDSLSKDLGTNVSNRVNKLDKNAAAFILQGAIDYLSM